MSKSKQKIISLNSEKKLYANLYIACQSREGDLDHFFAHENYIYPISISEFGKLRNCSAKSDFLQCTESMVNMECESMVNMECEAPGVSMKVLDGAAFVNMNPPRASNNYGEYCHQELFQKIRSAPKDTQRIDLVFNVYYENSLKIQTGENRGDGIRVSVRKTHQCTRIFRSL